MNWLSLLALLATAGLAHSTWDNCGGTCGLRGVVSDYYAMTYYYGHVAYDYGMTRVVGGTGALPGAWPWIVSIQHPWAPGLGHWCGGSLISTQWVLTAAHCFDKFDDISMLYVLIGATQLTQPGPGAQVRTIKQLHIHAYYNRADMSYDIAVLELDHPVQCSPYIQMACVPDATLKVSELQNCWIAGWGATTARDATSPDHLQEAKVLLIDVQTCNSSHWYAGDIHRYNLCAGYPQGTIDTCQGDSGGPLMCQDNNADYWWVVGVTSWGKGCARARQPGVYTSTQYFYDWILAQMGTSTVERASPTSQAWSHFRRAHQPIQKSWPRPTHKPWPAQRPTHKPWTTAAPTHKPWPTEAPTHKPWPTAAPTHKPWPAQRPTHKPWPTVAPTHKPWSTVAPTHKPWSTVAPTHKPWPTQPPTHKPWPTAAPTHKPWPTAAPTHKPWPTAAPTHKPWPTAAPTHKPWPTQPPTQKPLPTATPLGEVSSCPFPINKLVDFLTKVKKLLHEVLGQNTA